MSSNYFLQETCKGNMHRNIKKKQDSGSLKNLFYLKTTNIFIEGYNCCFFKEHRYLNIAILFFFKNQQQAITISINLAQAVYLRCD